MLRLDVSLLTGRFVATAHDDRGRAEWPPHPARVFSALVAAHHEAEFPDPLERSALLWLEQQPPPSMEVDRFADIRQVHDVFVPVNDVTLVGDRGAELREAERELAQSTGVDLKKAQKLVDKERKKLQAFMADQQKAEGETNAKAVATARALMPDKRLRQMRTFPVALPPSPHFSLVWEVAPEDSMIAALDRMCAKLTRLGHSSSLVSCRAYVGPAAPTLVPSSSGDVVLRVVGPGQLERLEREFEKHQAVEPRTLPFRPQRYGRPPRPAGAVPSQSVFASEGWILFERSGGSRPLSSRTGDLTRALRAALIEQHGPGLSPALSGHDPDGSPTTKPHLAFTALPFVGHEHADGSVQGFAIILPREMAEEDRVNALRLVAAWENANSDELTLGGNFPPMKLRRVDLSSKDALSPIRWTRPARRFITATPIALDRNPGNLRSNFEQTAAKASVHAQRTIADACEQVGLPRPPSSGGLVCPSAPWCSAGPGLCPMAAEARPNSAGACACGTSFRPGGGGPRLDWRRPPLWSRPVSPGVGAQNMTASESLSTRDFAAFHEAVHGYPPFDWQIRLLEQVVSAKAWPEVLDLPTGSGKTTCIDIAVFALALDAGSKSPWCPRRIAMVVDRRVVVDQVAERGRRLELALAEPKPGVLTLVASALRGLSREGEAPLGVFTLRGGMPQDEGWARTPDQPMVIASTVDQLGSRLLMQGYGVSNGAKPIHAGLVANDTLLLLDEVHLSMPFAQTLAAIQQLRGRFRELPHRFHVAFLSATPLKRVADPFKLSDADLAEGTTLGRRLRVAKPTRLVEEPDRTQVEARCVEEAIKLSSKHDVLAVVVNRVNSAAVVTRALRESLRGTVEVVLLTGRMRPLDRDEVVSKLRPRILSGRERTEGQAKLIVVATQCIEAGADFDFDAMVTEAASLDALRQRFGRVDRLGNYGKSEGVVVADKSAKEDPIYGTAAHATVAWLKTLPSKKAKEIDFGPLAPHFQVDDALRTTLVPEPKSAPILLPAYLDRWAQTSPPPAQLPELSLFLHGPQSGPADVQIVWRADLSKSQLDERTEEHDRAAIRCVAALRPSSLEAISVPFLAARRWLEGEATAFGDVEGAAEEAETDDSKGKARRAVRWLGDRSEVIDGDSDKLTPGSTLVVPAEYGGIGDACFDPASSQAVPDLAEKAALFSRGRAVLRVSGGKPMVSGLESIDFEEVAEAKAALVELAEGQSEGWRKTWLKHLARGRPLAQGPDSVLWLGGRVAIDELLRLMSGETSIEEGSEATTDEDDSSYLGVSVSLAVHSTDVETFARKFASAVGLSASLVEDLALAGWLHDIGKADRRFQLLLRQGDEIDLLKDETPWAKSGMVPGNKSLHVLAQKKSGYPRRARHEVQSVAMLERHREVIDKRAKDPDLVLHLIASHHGHCRPFAPVIQDAAPVEVMLLDHSSKTFGTVSFDGVTSNHQLHQLSSPIAERFWRLVSRYGWLELCWLEAILRLADHRASEAEQLSAGAGGGS